MVAFLWKDHTRGQSTGTERRVSASTESWEPLKRLRTHEQVLEAIEAQIVRGRLRPGDRLPSERELALAFGVSRPSVREALRVLEWTGVVVAGVGSGKEAGSIITNRVSDALTRVLRIHLALANFRLDDVVETRVALEAEAVVGASANASANDLERLAGLVDQMKAEDASLTPERFHVLDTDFHVAIAEASGNKLIAEMMQALREVVRQEMVRAFEGVDDWHVASRRIYSEHGAIVDMIANRNGVKARKLITNHILGFYRKGTLEDDLAHTAADGVDAAPRFDYTSVAE
jgi:DNA-binding FadR family transcriptional regulator